MFELKCVAVASALRIFWGLVNVTIGFHVQESSSSNLRMFYKIVPRTFECSRGLLKQLESLTQNCFSKVRLDLGEKKCNAQETESVTSFYVLSNHGKITDLNSIDCVYVHICMFIYFLVLLTVLVVFKSQCIYEHERFMGSGKGRKKICVIFCLKILLICSSKEIRNISVKIHLQIFASFFSYWQEKILPALILT